MGDLSPEDKKLISVINKIYAKTRAKELHWEPSADPNLLGLKLPDYTVSISRAPEIEGSPESFNLTISNGEGLVIQELSSYLAEKGGFTNMKDLFDQARRYAFDINGALDELVEELDEMSRGKS